MNTKSPDTKSSTNKISAHRCGTECHYDLKIIGPYPLIRTLLLTISTPNNKKYICPKDKKNQYSSKFLNKFLSK